MKLKGFAIGILVIVIIVCVVNIGATPNYFNKKDVETSSQVFATFPRVEATTSDPYHMILTDSMKQLDALVNDYIRRGWTPIGGVSAYPNSYHNDWFFAQAVVTNEYYEENIR